MQLTEQHVISKNHPLWAEADRLSSLSKNLYNASLYDVRQHYFQNKEYKPWQKQKGEFSKNNNPDYRTLPAKISGEVLMLVGQNFKSFFGALKSKRNGTNDRPVRIPNYLPKNGRQVVTFPKQSISTKSKDLQNGLWEHTVSPRELNFKFQTRHENIDIVRLVPKNSYYSLEVVYTVETVKPIPDNGKYASLDPGIDNLATVFYNTGDQPEIWSGKKVKSINQGYNREVSKLKSKLAKSTGGEQKTSKRIQKHHLRRKNRLKHELHAISNSIVNHLASKNVSQLIIGKNSEWKQDTKKMGRYFNQKFIQLPFEQFYQYLKYKCELVGIKVVFTEESYTSKASFLDRDVIPKYRKGNAVKYNFSGYRKSRGQYKSKASKVVLNADVNGAGNIMRKVIPENKVYFEGVEAVAIQPIKIKLDLS